MTQKKVQVWLPVLLSVALMLGMFFGYKLKDNMGAYSPSFFGKSQRTSLQEILELVKQRYVDTVNVDSLGYFAIEDVLNQLDPHSVYIAPQEVQSVNEDMQGNFQGIGIEFNMIDDTVHITAIMEKGPAANAGLEVGDQILIANDSVISGKKRKYEDIRKFFRGAKGTEIRTVILRNKQQKNISIKRGIIPIKSAEAAYMIETGIAYIRLNKFSSTTYEEFMENMERLQKEGMQKLILDLRGNGGGMLDDAVQIADEFLSGSKEIVYTEGKSYPRQNYTARRPGLFEEGKLILLIDEGSASASEVLAGALQDWDRAIILGRRSFGKGLVQEQFSLSDGSAVRLTISRYYTPIGRSIQKPYTRGEKDHYKNEVTERYSNGELFHGDSAAHHGKKYKTKGGRPVFGGGGISPDIYVAVDSTELFPRDKKQLYREMISQAAYYYYLQNKNNLRTIKTTAELQQTVLNNPAAWDYLTKAALKDSIQTHLLPAKQQQLLREYFAALVGRQLWHSEGYIKMKNFNDPLVIKALQEIKK
ncbi:MAG: S41 family peptidase [Chitinophagaceae bacterium]|nr:S41 family peptidase [Chitinophagaceae bacterium]